MDLQIHAPLSNLLDRYAADKAVLDQATSLLKTNDMLSKLISGALRKEMRGGYVPDNVNTETMKKVLDAKYWSSAFALGNFIDLMPAKDREEWIETIKNLDTPAFEKEIVESTIENLILNSRKMFARKVDGVFQSLSKEHVTNAPEGFGVKLIVYVDGFGCLNSDVIYDLFSVIGQCYGVGSKYAAHASNLVSHIPTDGQWRWAVGNICQIRRYKKGTMHIKLHDDVKVKLNDELHYLYPQAIPAKFRKPQKTSTVKPPELFDNLLSNQAIDGLKSIRIVYNGDYKLEIYNQPVDLSGILTSIGGVKFGKKEVECGSRYRKRTIDVWVFDYDPSEVVTEIIMLRSVPDKKAYQFYPTPESLAQRLAGMADIQPDEQVLEPSAGNGRIIDTIIDSGANITAVEISSLRCKMLKSKFADIAIHNSDFMSWQNKQGFDCIVMNPPFTKGQVLAHIRHAVSMLNPKGRLLAIVPAGFKADIGIDYELSENIDNAFKDASISVKVLMGFKL